MSATRHCFGDFQSYLTELPDGPRIGPVSRSGYESAYDIANPAGHSFPIGERDSRNVMTVDNLPHKVANPLASFDRTGAAGQGSPRVEVRCLTVDDRIRRARSEPPDLMATRLTQQNSAQVFGVEPGIDSPRFRRRVFSPQSPRATRDQASKTAARYANIEGITAKKHFQGTSGPGAWMSPRYAARCTELVDIDSHGGRMRSPGKDVAAENILPESQSFELEPSNEWSFEQTPRPHNLTYFVKTLEAENYAKLLGRPQSQPRTEFATKTSNLKLENLQKRERGWQRYSTTKGCLGQDSCASLDMATCDWSVVSSEPNSPIAHGRNRTYRSLSAMSTEASDEGSVRSDREPPLSKASRNIFKSLDGSDCGNNSTELGLPEDYADECSSPKRVPLGIRRVMASMMPDCSDLTEEMASQLQAAIGQSMQKLARTNQKNVRTRATIALHRQNITSPRRQGSAPTPKRNANTTVPKFRHHSEDMDDTRPVAVAG